MSGMFFLRHTVVNLSSPNYNKTIFTLVLMIYNSDVDGGICIMVTKTMTMTINMVKVVGKSVVADTQKSEVEITSNIV